jgi:hypothetical protein
VYWEKVSPYIVGVVANKIEEAEKAAKVYLPSQA